MEFTLLGAALVAALAGYGVLWFEAGRTNAADCTRDVWDALVTGLVVGLVVGRLAAMVLSGTNPLATPGDILIVWGGVDTVTAVFAGLGAFTWQVRADLWRLADAAAPAALAMLAGWHAGCLVRDTCLGTPSDLPWALAQPGSSVTRHPVGIYAALALILGVVALVAWKHRPPSSGTIGGSALAIAAWIRLATEPLRPGLGSDLTIFYAGAALVATALVIWLLRRRVGVRDG